MESSFFPVTKGSKYNFHKVVYIENKSKFLNETILV